MLLTAILIDDDLDCIQILRTMLTIHVPYVQIIGTAQSVQEGKVLLQNSKPDLLFLDVNMSPYTGFDLLESFPNPLFEIIFCTAFDDYAIRAIRFAAFDYLVKPIKASDLQGVFSRLMRMRDNANGTFDASPMQIDVLQQQQQQTHNTLKDRIVITTLGELVMVDIIDIVSLKGEGSYTEFYLANGKTILASRNLMFYEEILSEDVFFRTHKSYLINLHQVERFIKTESLIVMKTGQEISVSTRRKEPLLLRFREWNE